MNRTDVVWVYQRSEPNLYTVGYYDPSHNWHADSDHGNVRDAAGRVHFLNGGGNTEASTNNVFVAQLHGKWMAYADAITDQAREMNRHFFDLADSLRKIARSLEVTIAINADATPDLLDACRKALSCLAPEDDDVLAQALRAAIAKAEGRML